MATYELTSQSGEKFEVNAPDDATEDQVMAFFKKNMATESSPMPQAGPISEGSQSTIQPPENKVRSDLLKRQSDRFKKTTDMIDRRLDGGSTQGIINTPGSLALATGQVAGGVLDTVATGVGQMASAVTPEPVKEWGKEKVGQLLQTDIGQAGLAALQKGQEAWNGFEKSNPDAAMALSGIVNLTAFGVTKKTAAAIEGEVKNVASDIARISTKFDNNILDGKMLHVVEKNVPKAIRPSVAGKNTSSQAKKYYKDAHKAVDAIIENKSILRLTDEAGEIVEGQLPKNLLQFSEAIEQTRKKIFTQYDELAKNTTGHVVDIEPLIKKLRGMRNKNIGMRVFAKELSGYGDEIADSLMMEGNLRGRITASDAQDLLQDLNARLSAHYKNPKAEHATKNFLDANIASELRDRLDDAIMKATGEEYGVLKKQYGALKTIENDVNRRLLVEVRKDMKGLLDFTDVFSGSQAINAIAQKNAPLFLAATAAKGIASHHKRLKDPNRYVAKLFSASEDLWQQKQGFTPKSKTFKTATEAKGLYSEMKKMEGFDPRNPVNLQGEFVGPGTSNIP